LTPGAKLAAMDAVVPVTRLRVGTWLMRVTTLLAAAMVVTGVVAWVRLEAALAVNSNAYVDWRVVQRIYLGIDVAATVALLLATVGVLLLLARYGKRSGRTIAGILAGCLVLLCALPSAGLFSFFWDDMLWTDREFAWATYGRWYLPVIGGLGAGYALAALATAVVLVLPVRANTGDSAIV
jgi:hypothetical protein